MRKLKLWELLCIECIVQVGSFLPTRKINSHKYIQRSTPNHVHTLIDDYDETGNIGSEIGEQIEEFDSGNSNINNLSVERDDIHDDGDDKISSILPPPISEKVGGRKSISDGNNIPSIHRGNNNFERNERWLEEATDKFVKMPLGRLREDDGRTVIGLMVAWSRRKSLEAAMIVEKLLKRVVDEMRVGSEDVHVSTRMYSIAIYCWGNVGETERASTIHDEMIQTYQQTKNPLIKPTTKSFNTLLLAVAKSKNRSALRATEKVLRDMITQSDATGNVRPDTKTFSTMLDFYARKGTDESVVKAETLIKSMRGLGVKKNNQVYSALQKVYLNSGRKNASEKTMAVLKKMMSYDSQGDVVAQHNIGNVNNVLCAYSRTPSKESALRAVEMLNQIEMPLEKGGYDLKPDRLSYFLTILAFSRCPDHTLGANKAEPLLELMEEKAEAEAKRRKDLSIAAPPLVYLDIECFNVVLTAIQKSYSYNAVDRIFKIISRMEDYADEGQEHLRPNTRSLNTALNALSHSKTIDAVQRSEEILERMFQLHIGGTSNIKPDAFSYTAILRSYQRIRTPEAAQRAHDILSHMEELFETKILDEPPDVVHYTIVCSAWTLSGSRKGPRKCIEILSLMKAKDKEGRPKVRPNIRTYNAILDCLSRSLEADKAEELLYHMLSLAKNGVDSAKPDAFSFDAVINAFIRSKIKDAGRRAESVLERGLEYAEDGGGMLEIKSFTSILGYYGQQTKVVDSPYRAQYILNRLISLFKNGNTHLTPHVSCFTNVMEAYAAQRHRDAGEYSEELLRSMIKLQRKYNARNLEVNTGVMNCVLNSWAESAGNDQAGVKAEHLLNLMEKSDTGNYNMTPNHRTYNLVLRSWSKSSFHNKAGKALNILHRAKKRYLNQKLSALPSEYTYSLVIHACAFSASAGPDMKMKAFEIASDVMTMLIDDGIEPSPATYGWFFQVCGRLRIPEKFTKDDIKRLFSRCCDKGRFNEFVLQSLKQATSDMLFANLMLKISENTAGIFSQKRKSDTKQTIQLSHLPKDWCRDNQTEMKNKVPSKSKSRQRY